MGKVNKIQNTSANRSPDSAFIATDPINMPIDPISFSHNPALILGPEPEIGKPLPAPGGGSTEEPIPESPKEPSKPKKKTIKE